MRVCIFIGGRHIDEHINTLRMHHVVNTSLSFAPLSVPGGREPPGQIFKVKTGRVHKKLRGGGVATSVRGEVGRARGDWGRKRGGSSC